LIFLLPTIPSKDCCDEPVKLRLDSKLCAKPILPPVDLAFALLINDNCEAILSPPARLPKVPPLAIISCLDLPPPVNNGSANGAEPRSFALAPSATV